MDKLEKRYIDLSLMPKRYIFEIALTPSKKDVKAFQALAEIKSNVKDFVKKGKNLFIYSNHVGNGKTTFATKIMKEYIHQVSDVYIDYPALFINVNDFINKKKIAISNNDIRSYVEKVESNILSAKLVIFDDVGVTNISDYDSNLLYYWINYRTDNMLSSIYTSNLSPDKLKTIIDERIFSRIVNYSTCIEITDGDNRSDNTASSTQLDSNN